jgi:hypothetical protein
MHACRLARAQEDGRADEAESLERSIRQLRSRIERQKDRFALSTARLADINKKNRSINVTMDIQVSALLAISRCVQIEVCSC